MKCCETEKKCPFCKLFNKDNCKCFLGKLRKKPGEDEAEPVEELGNSGICSLCAIVGAVVLLGTSAFFIFKGVLKCVKDNNC